MKKLLVAMLVAMFVTMGGGVALGADVGTLTLNSDTRVEAPGATRAIRVIEFGWLTDASGDCGETLNRATAVTGTVIGLHAIPDTDTDGYDATIIDGNGVDVLNGDGIDLPSTVTSVENYRCPVDFQNSSPIMIVEQDLTLVIDDGGDKQDGVIRIYILLP